MLRKGTRWKRNDLEMKECLGRKDLESRNSMRKVKDEEKKECERDNKENKRMRGRKK